MDSTFCGNIPSSSCCLSTFPFLTSEEFDGACRALLDRISRVGTTDVVWLSSRLVHQATGPVLKIQRKVDLANIHPYDNPQLQGPNNQEEEEASLETSEDDDSEALVRLSNPDADLQVEYQVLLSTTYQVPVLYFTLRQAGQSRPLGIDRVYQHVVPGQYRQELQSVGIMGGISFGYHPNSGAPTFFVHPCNTMDAMKQITGNQHVTPELYLILWFGLVGNRLGLYLPRELFETYDIYDL